MRDDKGLGIHETSVFFFSMWNAFAIGMILGVDDNNWWILVSFLYFFGNYGFINWLFHLDHAMVTLHNLSSVPVVLSDNKR